MGRMTASNNVTGWAYESGTYANTSGTAQWPGFVQNVSPEDTENIQRIRFHGTGTRNVDRSTIGAKDYGFTQESYPSDFRMLMFALGNVADATTGSPTFYTHTLSELNTGTLSPMISGTEAPFTSFGYETTQKWNVSGQNLVRTYKGCVVDSYNLAKSDNSSPITETVTCIAKTRDYSSGAPTLGTPTEATRRPYTPFDVLLHVPSGTKLDAKAWDFGIKNNFDRDGAHVANGSREIGVPTPTEREYNLTLSMEAESSQAARLYGLYVSGGLTTTNAALEIKNFGGTSGTSWIALSGCDIDDFTAPNPVEGVNEWGLTLIPKSSNAIIQDQILLYKGW